MRYPRGHFMNPAVGAPAPVEDPDKIPIRAARALADLHNYDQVIIYARRLGEPGLEWVTTYGRDPEHCQSAARIGDALRDDVVPTLERMRAALLAAREMLDVHGKMVWADSRATAFDAAPIAGVISAIDQALDYPSRLQAAPTAGDPA